MGLWYEIMALFGTAELIQLIGGAWTRDEEAPDDEEVVDPFTSGVGLGS